MLPEPVTIVTTVAGLLGFTVSALSTIDRLRLFWRDLKDDAVKSFVHDLEVAENLLGEVEHLCSSLKKEGATQLPGIRLETLHIHVEDCGRDLQRWLRISSQFASRRGRTTTEMVHPPLTLRPKAFENFLHAIRKASRTDVKTSLGWHQENIKMSLSLLNV
jgi:hypothetical protein